MWQLREIKARVVRLQELTQSLAKEVTAWKGRESSLSLLERHQRLDGLQDVVEGLDEARVTLAATAKRLERETVRRPPL